MTSVRETESAAEPKRVEVLTSGDRVVVRDADVFGSRLSELGPVFLARVFALAEVRGVELDAALGQATVIRSRGSGLVAFLERLALVLRGRSVEPAVAVAVDGLATDLPRNNGRITVRRLGSLLTTWTVVNEQTGRVRLRHEAIGRDVAALARVCAQANRTMGVIRARWSSLTGSLLIEYEPRETSLAHIVASLDGARRLGARGDQNPDPGPPRFTVANTCLILAAASHTVAPALAPVCALLLVTTNLRTLRAAARQLQSGRIGLPILYTGIITGALVSGQFLACAFMSWMIVYWRKSYRETLLQARTGLLGEIVNQPLHARRAAAGMTEVQTEIDSLRPGDVLLLHEHEVIPVDGRLIDGGGLVDERLVAGSEGWTRKREGDWVHSGSILRSGWARIEVVRPASEGRAAVLSRALLSASTPRAGAHAKTADAEAFADQKVAPTLAVASVGLLVGDVTAAAAILAPDYATGVGMAHPLETLQAVALCAHHGVLVREATAIERLTQVDLVVLDHHPALASVGCEVAHVRTFGEHSQDDVLRLAAAAFHELDEPRAHALWRTCQTRSLKPPQAAPFAYIPDIAYRLDAQLIKVGDHGATDIPRAGAANAGGTEPADPGDHALQPLMIGVNGRIAGLIQFQPSTQYKAAAAIARLRAKRGIAVGLISSRPTSDIARLATALNLDFHTGGFSLDDRAHMLKICREQGRRIAYVGDCRLDPRLAEYAHASFSLIGDQELELDDDPASFWLMGRGVAALPEIWDVAHIHKRRLASARGRAIVPNLICVAGAFAWGFTSFASVIITNLGTYAIHARTRSSILRLEQQIVRSLRHRPFPGRSMHAEPVRSIQTALPHPLESRS